MLSAGWTGITKAKCLKYLYVTIAIVTHKTSIYTADYLYSTGIFTVGCTGCKILWKLLFCPRGCQNDLGVSIILNN